MLNTADIHPREAAGSVGVLGHSQGTALEVAADRIRIPAVAVVHQGDLRPSILRVLEGADLGRTDQLVDLVRMGLDVGADLDHTDQEVVLGRTAEAGIGLRADHHDIPRPGTEEEA